MTSLVFIAGATTVFAADPTKFISLDACKTYYAGSGQTSDAYCADKIMTAAEVCTETKISEYVQANKLTAFTQLTNTEQYGLRNKFSYQCQVATQSTSASATQQAVLLQQQQAAAKAAAAAANSAAHSSNQNTAADTQMLMGLAKQGSKILQNDDKQKISDSKSSNDSSTQGSGQSSSVNNSADTANDKIIQANEAAKKNGTDAKDELAKIEANPSNSSSEVPALTDTNNPASANYINASDAASDKAAASAAKGDVGSAAAETTEAIPQAKSAVDELTESSKISSDTPGKKTDITSNAESTSQTLNSNVSQTVSTANSSLTSDEYPYSQTVSAMQQLQSQVQSYTSATKKTCNTTAETASFLCIESTNPGAKAAKKVMETAGPVLAVVSSAQKTCSSTAKVTRLVNLGLTIAKGVCVASKLACDGACALAISNLGKVQASIATQVGSAIDTDYTTNDTKCQSDASSQCASATVGYAACYAAKYGSCAGRNSARKAQAVSYSQQLQGYLKSENAPATPGTSPAIAKGCQAHIKDIALLGVQVAGTLAAQQNAKACEEKLASSGSAGATVTTQKYCEKPENTNTQLCICQKNSTATGCPGALAASASTTDSAAAEKGANIKSSGGNSAFASFGAAGAKPSIGTNGLKKNSALGFSASGVSATGSATGSSSDAGGVGVSGGSGGGVSATASSSGDSESKKEADAKKKWSFGSFGESAVGALGGGSIGSAASKNGKPGSLSRDEAAIKRQLASEKYATEVSTASGKSNWEKVRHMYLIKEGSFILGQ